MIRPGRAIPPCMREAIDTMEGSTHKEVADRLGCHARTVQRWRSRKKEVGNMESKQGGKRWSKVEDRDLVQHCLEGFWSREPTSECIRSYASKVGVTEPQVRKAVSRLQLRETRMESLAFVPPSPLDEGCAFSWSEGGSLFTAGAGRGGGGAWAETKQASSLLYPLCRHPLMHDGLVDGSTYLRLPSKEVVVPSVLKDEGSASLFLQRHGFEEEDGSSSVRTASRVLDRSYQMGGLSVPEGVPLSQHKDALLLSGIRVARVGGGTLHPPSSFPSHILPLLKSGHLKGASQHCILFLLGSTKSSTKKDTPAPGRTHLSFREAMGGRSVKPLGERWMTLPPDESSRVTLESEESRGGGERETTIDPRNFLPDTDLWWEKESPLVCRAYHSKRSSTRMVTHKERLKWFRSEMPTEAWCLAWEMRAEDLASLVAKE